MDNVVQKININDIIPSAHQSTNEEKLKIEELAQMIKKFGLFDPIIVRPKNGKYEIVLGVEKYEAAKIAKLNKVPVLVKDIADDVFMQYTNIDNNTNKSVTTPPNETFSQNKKNNDIINLKDLNKEIIEYERDDFKMNNDMLNNNVAQAAVPPKSNEQGPTFGGKFFPSLEDEPTNMNMMGGINNPAPAPMAPSNNNLIDLTDLSPDKEVAVPAPTTNLPPLNNNPLPNPNNMEVPNMGVPNPLGGPVPTADSVLNVSNLQNNNQPAPVAPAPEPVSMETLQADFGGPAPTPISNNLTQPMSNEFNIPQNIGGAPAPTLNPTPEIGPMAPTISPTAPMPNNPSINDALGLNQPPVAPPNLGPVPEFNTPPMPTPNMGPELNINSPIPQPIQNPALGPSLENNNTSKDTTSVVSFLKAVASNLELFGYKININEENLPNITKIIVEVEK